MPFMTGLYVIFSLSLLFRKAYQTLIADRWALLTALNLRAEYFSLFAKKRRRSPQAIHIAACLNRSCGDCFLILIGLAKDYPVEGRELVGRHLWRQHTTDLTEAMLSPIVKKESVQG